MKTEKEIIIESITTALLSVAALICACACALLYREFVPPAAAPAADLCENPYGIRIHCEDELLLPGCFSELDKLPGSILTRFKEEGWELYVGTQYVAGVRAEYNNERITGMTRPRYKSILVSSGKEVFHEFGHFLYIELGEPDSFKSIYEHDKTLVDIHPHFTSNDHEFFAEFFACYLDGEDVLESIPLTELYMSTLSQRGWITN